MDKKYLKEKGLLEGAQRFQRIVEYVTAYDNAIEEVDSNADGLDDATGMPDAMGMGGAAMGGAMPGMPADPMAGAAAPADPSNGAGAVADPNAATGNGGAPGFDPAQGETETPATTQEPLTDPVPEDSMTAGGEDAGDSDEEVIDVDELVDGQKSNQDAIEKLTDKFESFLEKFSEFQGELKANADFMAKLEGEFEKRNPTSVEKMTMRSLQSKPFQETPEEYMKYDAPENYSPEDDNNGVGEPRYTITRDDVKNATDYSSIAKTLRDNGNATLKSLLGL